MIIEQLPIEPIVDSSIPPLEKKDNLEKFEEGLGITTVDQARAEQKEIKKIQPDKSDEAQAEFDKWRKMSVDIPREPNRELFAKARMIADPGLRKRTERYVKANWYNEEGDRLWNNSEKLAKEGKTTEVEKLRHQYENLYKKAEEEYKEADHEYAVYEQTKRINETAAKFTVPKNKGFFSKGLSKFKSWFGGKK